jgi:hypothetical protein
MIHLFRDGKSTQPGMVCLYVVDMMISESLETEKNTPGCANDDERSFDQIYV